MVNLITIPPPPGSTQATLEAEARPLKVSRVQQIAIAIKDGKAAARAREARVKTVLELGTAGTTPSDVLAYVSNEASPQLSTEESDSATSATSFRGVASRLLAMSISGSLNNLLSVALWKRSAGSYSAVPADAVDSVGPPLRLSFGAFFTPERAILADTANVFEFYLIVCTAVRCAPLGSEGMLDAYMLIKYAVGSGYLLCHKNIRQTLVAALSIAHQRAGAKQRQPKEHAQAFAARCFPSLNLRNLAATEYMLLQKLAFDLRRLDARKDRQNLTKELAMFALHHEQAFGNYLRIITRNEKRQRDLEKSGASSLQTSLASLATITWPSTSE
eukprot:6201666-Pleurochrysis_carterae.AAC.2